MCQRAEVFFFFFLLPRDYTTFLYWCSYCSLSASRFVGRAYYVLKLLWNSSPADDKRHYLITETMSGKSGWWGGGMVLKNEAENNGMIFPRPLSLSLSNKTNACWELVFFSVVFRFLLLEWSKILGIIYDFFLI